MGNKIALSLVVVLGVLLLLFPFFLKNTEDPIKTKPSPKEEPQYNINNVVLVGHKDGVKNWMLQANSLIDQGKTNTLLNGLEYGELYENDEVKYIIKADSGEYNRKTEDFRLIHNVKITTNDGESMRTDEIFYENRKKIMTSGLVEIKTNDAIVNATKMTVDVDKDIYEFFGDIKVEFNIEDEDQTENGV